MSYFSFDRLEHLKALSIFGHYKKNFNFGLFDNLCNHLEELLVYICEINNRGFAKLFYGRNFPFLNKLIIKQTSITKIEKKLLDAFPALQVLAITENDRLRIIDQDAFSNSKQLISLNLSNNRIMSIGRNLFSHLTKLRVLKLSNNRLKSIPKNVLSSQVESLKIIDLSNNRLSSLDPKLIDDLRNLKCMDLRNNNLKNFDAYDNENIKLFF